MYSTVDFGPNHAGLGTVGYELRSKTAIVQARTTVNVRDEDNGAYSIDDPGAPADAVFIKWDTGGASPIYAHENLQFANFFSSLDLNLTPFVENFEGLKNYLIENFTKLQNTISSG